MDRIVSLQIHVEALTPNVTVFGDGASGWSFELDEVIGVGPHDGISALTRRDTRSLLPTSLTHLRAAQRRGHMSTQQEGGRLQTQRRGLSVRPMFDLGIPASRTVGDKYLLFKPRSLLSLVVFLW